MATPKRPRSESQDGTDGDKTILKLIEQANEKKEAERRAMLAPLYVPLPDLSEEQKVAFEQAMEKKIVDTFVKLPNWSEFSVVVWSSVSQPTKSEVEKLDRMDPIFSVTTIPEWLRTMFRVAERIKSSTGCCVGYECDQWMRGEVKPFLQTLADEWNLKHKMFTLRRNQHDSFSLIIEKKE